jgi:Zn-dependent peptidase ImmA (M78 family)
LAVGGERLELFAAALNYPVHLLRVNEREVGAGPGFVHHRKKQSASAVDLRRIHAMLNLTRIQLHGVLADVPRPAATGIPHIPADDYDTPDDAARAIRAKWGISEGPLASVVDVLEGAGSLVVSRDLIAPIPLDSGAETVPVDAVSTCPVGEDPVVLLNTGTPAERQRFTLAHELGHMVMHPVPHPQQEKQANAFAAELLMPMRQVRSELQGTLDLSRLLDLKAQWQVSVWALMRRAHTLGVISDWQYRTLAVEMSSLGYRTAEPGTLQPETPSVVRSAIAEHLKRGRRVEDLARKACLNADEFVGLYLGSDSAPTGASPSAGPVSSTATGDVP